MPDISKCSNNKCSLRHECYRVTCESSGVSQSYTEFNPIVDNGIAFCCHYFINIEDRLSMLNVKDGSMEYLKHFIKK